MFRLGTLKTSLKFCSTSYFFVSNNFVMVFLNEEARDV